MRTRSLAIEPAIAVAALVAATGMIVLVLIGVTNGAALDIADLARAARGPF
jgi:hypothetical protein